MFKKRENVVEIEEGNLFSPKFDNDGLIPVITTCSKTKEILMHGYMNIEALKKTIETKEAHYFSRSRKNIWHKFALITDSCRPRMTIFKTVQNQLAYLLA